MSPEQLEGKDADPRTDILAFGALLYEMLSGRPAFEGGSRASLIAAILERDPPPIATRLKVVPAALERLVRLCLAKNPDDRWQSAHDVLAELRWIAETGTSAAAVPSPTSQAWRGRLGWAAVGAALAVTGFLAAGRPRQTPVGARPVRFCVYPPEGTSFTFLGRDAGPVAVSPDGRLLAFVATTSAGRKLIFIRPLELVSSQPLAGSDGASYPFWSPDSRNLGFFADGKLKRVAVLGGPVVTLGEAPFARGGTWIREGVIVFAPSAYVPLYRISASGGPASPVTHLDKSSGEVSHRWPHFLPDGRHFLFFSMAGLSQTKEGNRLHVGSLDGEEKPLFATATGTWNPPGQILFVRDTTLFARPFDSRSLDVEGEPVPVAEQVQVYRNTASAVFSASDNDVLAYQAGAAPLLSQLVWFDRGGKQVGTVGLPGDYEGPRLSPDGSRVAVDRIDPNTGVSSLWLCETARELSTRFTFASRDHNAVWSPDGRFLVYQELDPVTKYDLWLVPLSGDRKPTPLLHGDGNETDGQVSPDGRFLAYTSDESGRREVYVSGLPGPSGKWQVSVAGGSQPRWRHDGREIFFLGADRKLMMATVKPGHSFEAGAAAALAGLAPPR